MSSRTRMYNQRLFAAGFIAFAMVCCLLLLPGCAEDETAQQAESEAAAEQTTEQATEQAADAGKEIQLSSHYSYRLQEDAVEVTDFEKTECFSDERYFSLADGTVTCRSFTIPNDPDDYPDLVGVLYEGIEADIGCSGFFDTVVETVDDEHVDAQGNKLYRRSYFWEDGAATLCALSFISDSKENLETGDKVLETVRYKDIDIDDQDDLDVPSDEDDTMHPYIQEIDQAMIREAQKAMQNMLDEDAKH